MHDLVDCADIAGSPCQRRREEGCQKGEEESGESEGRGDQERFVRI